eukprot:4056905-Amphidinium_carterae.1
MSSARLPAGAITRLNLVRVRTHGLPINGDGTSGEPYIWLVMTAARHPNHEVRCELQYESSTIVRSGANPVLLAAIGSVLPADIRGLALA